MVRNGFVVLDVGEKLFLLKKKLRLKTLPINAKNQDVNYYIELMFRAIEPSTYYCIRL